MNNEQLQLQINPLLTPLKDLLLRLLLLGVALSLTISNLFWIITKRPRSRLPESESKKGERRSKTDPLSSPVVSKMSKMDQHGRYLTISTALASPLLSLIPAIVQLFNFSESNLAPSCKVTNLLGTFSLQSTCILVLLWTSLPLFQRSTSRKLLVASSLLLWLSCEAWSMSVLAQTDNWLQASTSIYDLSSSQVNSSSLYPTCLPPFTIFHSRDDKTALPSLAARSVARVLSGGILLIFTWALLIIHIHSLKRTASHQSGENRFEMEEGGGSRARFEDGNQELETRNQDQQDSFKMRRLSGSDSFKKSKRAMRQEASDSTLVDWTPIQKVKSLKKLHLSPASTTLKLQENVMSSSPTRSSMNLESLPIKQIDNISTPRLNFTNSPSTSESALILILSLVTLLSSLLIAFLARTGSWRGSGAAMIEIGFSGMGTILRFVLEKRSKEEGESFIQKKVDEINEKIRCINSNRRRSSQGGNFGNVLRFTSTSQPQQCRPSEEDEADTTLVTLEQKFTSSSSSHQRVESLEISDSNEEKDLKVKSGNDWRYSTISNDQNQPDSPTKENISSSLRSSLPSSNIEFDHNQLTFNSPFTAKFERSFSDSPSIASTSHRLNSRLVAENALTGSFVSIKRPIMQSPLPSYLLSTERAEQANQGLIPKDSSSFASSEGGDETLLRRLRAQDLPIDSQTSERKETSAFRNPFVLGDSPSYLEKSSPLGGGHTHNSTEDSFGNIKNSCTTPFTFNFTPAVDVGLEPEVVSDGLRRPSLFRNPLSVEGEKVVLLENKVEETEEEEIPAAEEIKVNTISALAESSDEEESRSKSTRIGNKYLSNPTVSFSPSPLAQTTFNRSSLGEQISSESFLDLHSSPDDKEREVNLRLMFFENEKEMKEMDSRESPRLSLRSIGSTTSFSKLSKTRNALSKVFHSSNRDLSSSFKESLKDNFISEINVADSQSRDGSSKSLKSPRSSAFSLVKARHLLSKPSSSPNLKGLSSVGDVLITRTQRDSLLEPLSRDPFGVEVTNSSSQVQENGQYEHSEDRRRLYHSGVKDREIANSQTPKDEYIRSDPLEFYDSLV